MRFLAAAADAFLARALRSAAAQVDGYTPAADAEMPLAERIAIADAFFQAIAADVRHGGNEAFSISDHIQMPPFAAFRESVAYHSTLAHEHTHWSATAARCDRQLASASEITPTRLKI